MGCQMLALALTRLCPRRALLGRAALSAALPQLTEAKAQVVRERQRYLRWGQWDWIYGFVRA